KICTNCPETVASGNAGAEAIGSSRLANTTLRTLVVPELKLFRPHREHRVADDVIDDRLLAKGESRNGADRSGERHAPARGRSRFSRASREFFEVPYMSHMRADGVAGLTGFELTNATRKPRL